ncbi:hypothetical protein BJ165DRAFT_1598905 [Panaeolus papilionaceus]|nr:hypothetical protein BJ165DRAFT_1598905 [Panaeolus papilionaceus]
MRNSMCPKDMMAVSTPHKQCNNFETRNNLQPFQDFQVNFTTFSVIEGELRDPGVVKVLRKKLDGTMDADSPMPDKMLLLGEWLFLEDGCFKMFNRSPSIQSGHFVCTTLKTEVALSWMVFVSFSMSKIAGVQKNISSFFLTGGPAKSDIPLRVKHGLVNIKGFQLNF